MFPSLSTCLAATARTTHALGIDFGEDESSADEETTGYPPHASGTISRRPGRL